MTQDIPANPYVGPVPFEQGKRLYGRLKETNEVIDMLISERIVLLYAPSGAGKTSLINAALLPALIKKNFDVLGPSRVSTPPAEVLQKIGADFTTSPDQVNRFVLSTLAGFLNQSPPAGLPQMTLDGYIQEKLKESKDSYRSLLLVVDQFEEILTIDPIKLEAKQAFFEQLGRALENQNVWALFAMREDFLGGMAPYLSCIPNRFVKRYRLDLLGVEAAKEAIRMPVVKDLRGVFEEEAASDLVESLREVIVQDSDGRPIPDKGPYVEPVHLQVICQSLWERERENPKVITRQDVINFGSVSDALALYYNTVIGKVSSSRGISERAIRDWVEFQLITPHGMRGQVLRGEKRTQGLENSLIDELINAFLVRKETRLGSVWYELAHDRLLDPVRKNNNAWREENLVAFQKKALIWDLQGRPSAALLPATELRDAEAWADTHDEQLSPVERQFLTLSQVALQTSARTREEEVARRTNLEDLGWGVIFPAEADKAWVEQTRTALKELLDWRRQQAGARRPEYFHEFFGDKGFKSDQTARDFLTENGAGIVQSTPEKMPAYLMIVGDPQQIPFEFQYGLDLQYSVGRIYFDEPEDYARYARSVVMCEKGEFSLPRRAVFTTPKHPEDRASIMLHDELARPLVEWASQNVPGWEITSLLGNEATKANFSRLLGKDGAPAFLFFTGHALNWPKGHPQQAISTGALLMQDWPGAGSGEIKPQYYYGAVDVDPEARLLGSVAFLLSNSTVGQPQYEDFAAASFRDPVELGSRPILANLPKKLLSHANGGMLGVMGHVERAWGYSFTFGKDQRDTIVFQETMRRILSGYTLGAAIEPFNQRYAVLSAEIAEKTREFYFSASKGGRRSSGKDPYHLASLETAVVDARNYIIIGDPAARLPITRGVMATERPVIPPVDPIPRPVVQPVPPVEHPVETIPEPEPAAGDQFVQAPVENQQQAVQTKYQAPSKSYTWSGATRRAVEKSEEMVFFNGVDGSSGEYSLPPMTISQFANLISSWSFNKTELVQAKKAIRWLQEGHYSPIEANMDDLEQVGWGLVIAQNTPTKVLSALDPLIHLRQEQSSKRFKILKDARALGPDANAETWLARLGVRPGALDPDRLPYYLLLVGSPENLPLGIETQLSDYAVGRLHFDDINGYHEYATRIAALEMRSRPRQKTVSFFSPVYPDDSPGRQLNDQILRPLSELLQENLPDWRQTQAAGTEATRTRFLDTLRQEGGPSLLITGGHGINFPSGHPSQARYQGGLVCSDWPGPANWRGPLSPEHFVSADDLRENTQLDGLLALMLSSYSAGSLADDSTLRLMMPGYAGRPQQAIISPLAQRMLAGGALGVFGLAGQSWIGSLQNGRSSHIDAFMRLLHGIAHGQRAGHALGRLREVYTQSFVDLANKLEEIHFGMTYRPEELADDWSRVMTLRGVSLIGDPAARMPAR